MRSTAEHFVLLMVLIGGATLHTDAHGSHGHGSSGDGHKKNTAFQKNTIIQDTDHIKEHVGEHVKGVDDMKPEELQFHFFITHDLNKDKKLDGLEIFFSLEHAVEHMAGQGPKMNGTEAQERVMAMTDDVLSNHDLDRDGYLTYAEFSLGHKRAAEQRDKTTTHQRPTEVSGHHRR